MRYIEDESNVGNVGMGIDARNDFDCDWELIGVICCFKGAEVVLDACGFDCVPAVFARKLLVEVVCLILPTLDVTGAAAVFLVLFGGAAIEVGRI